MSFSASSSLSKTVCRPIRTTSPTIGRCLCSLRSSAAVCGKIDNLIPFLLELDTPYFDRAQLLRLQRTTHDVRAQRRGIQDLRNCVPRFMTSLGPHDPAAQ